MQTVEKILDHRGHKTFAEFVGVGLSNVTHMRVNGKFPAKKYVLVRKFCAEHGLDEPGEDLFSFDDAQAAE